MDVTTIMAAVSKMFPSADISGAVQRVQGILKGTPDTIDGARQAAANAGLNKNAVEEIYNRYGRSAKARVVCQMLGTTPEALRDDAMSLVSSGVGRVKAAPEQKETKKFPRLK